MPSRDVAIFSHPLYTAFLSKKLLGSLSITDTVYLTSWAIYYSYFLESYCTSPHNTECKYFYTVTGYYSLQIILKK